MNNPDLDSTGGEELISRPPQTIRELYEALEKGFGQGENPLFNKAPDNVLVRNWIGIDKEKSLFYVYDENGKVKEWLTEEEINNIKNRQEREMTKEELFDMFSFMVGGRNPNLNDLGYTNWIELLESQTLEEDPKIVGM